MKSLRLLVALFLALALPLSAAQQTIGVGTSANDGTGDNPRAAGQKINANFTELYTGLATSAGLAALISDENGSGKLIFANGTLSIATGKTATFSNTLTFTGTDGSTLNIGTGGTLGTAAFATLGGSGGNVPTWSSAPLVGSYVLISAGGQNIAGQTFAEFITDLGLITTADTGTVTNAMLAGSIGLSKLAITGTPTGAKFLRDDYSWQTVSGSGGLASTDLDTSAELRAIVTDETGTGALVFAGGNIGAATATSLNGLVITSGAGSNNGGSGSVGAAGVLAQVGGNNATSGGSGNGGSAGDISTSGGAANTDTAGGAGGGLFTFGSGIYAGGSLRLDSNGSNAAGSINTRAGGSLTMGAGSITGPAHGVTLTTTGTTSLTLPTTGTLATTADIPTLLIHTQDFRLTTESGVAVSGSDRTAQSTLYLTPFKGNRIALYSGSAWVMHTTAQISLALSGLTSGKNYDVFAYNNAGTITLELSAAWTNDSTPADGITTQDGVLVKSGATTRRWLGTIRTTATTTTEDSESKRFVWNVNNQVARRLHKYQGVGTEHTYSTSTQREWNGGTGGPHRVYFVVGEVQWFTHGFWCQFIGASDGAGIVNLSLNSVAAEGDAAVDSSTGLAARFGCSATSKSAVGFNELIMTENSFGTGNTFNYYRLTAEVWN